MMKSKTTLGGAITAFGTTLLGVGTLAQLSQLSPTSNVLSPHQLATLWYIALAGFIISGIGKFFTSYYAADDKDVQSIAKAVYNINQAGPSPLAPTATDTNITKKQ